MIWEAFDYKGMTVTSLPVIGNHNCRVFRNQEYRVFGNKGAEKMATRNAEICRINTPGNGTNPLFIKAYGLS
jgi:hypothetical protein